MIPYQPAKNGAVQLTDKVISAADVRAIKAAFCRTQVFYGFYDSGIVTIKSPTDGSATFWRRNIELEMSLVKVGTDWRVTDIKREIPFRPAKKGRWNQLLDSLSRSAP
jgi:hypothetical protein